MAVILLGKLMNFLQETLFKSHPYEWIDDTIYINAMEKRYHIIVIDIAEEDKKLNATYIISVARKLGCSIFLLPEDVIEVIIDLKVNIPNPFSESFLILHYWWFSISCVCFLLLWLDQYDVSLHEVMTNIIFNLCDISWC